MGEVLQYGASYGPSPESGTKPRFSGPGTTLLPVRIHLFLSPLASHAPLALFCLAGLFFFLTLGLEMSDTKVYEP